MYNYNVMLNKIFYTYTPALFLVLGIGFLIYILGFSFIWADDTDIIVYSKSNLLLEPLNGLFLPSTLDRFFGYYLPFKMDIHPSDFKSIYRQVYYLCPLKKNTSFHYQNNERKTQRKDGF